jgi:hypothetical protein
VLAGAGCAAAAVIGTGGTAAAASPARLNAAHTPAAASAAAAANGRIAFSQWDLLPGGNLSGHSNVYTINPEWHRPAPAHPHG